MTDALQGQKVAFLVANEGIEQVELTRPWQAVKRTPAGTRSSWPRKRAWPRP